MSICQNLIQHNGYLPDKRSALSLVETVAGISTDRACRANTYYYQDCRQFQDSLFEILSSLGIKPNQCEALCRACHHRCDTPKFTSAQCKHMYVEDYILGYIQQALQKCMAVVESGSRDTGSPPGGRLPKKGSPSKSVVVGVMNQQCKVCGEPAAGYHFGAFTCEGCKSFFGRTFSNSSHIAECKNGNACVINKKNRTACKSCRLRKCLNVGMSKSGSRYGRRSNWFKIHCLLQNQTTQNLNLPPSSGVPYPQVFLSGLLRSDNRSYNNDRRDVRSPSQSDVTHLQSQLLHAAMLRQEREQQQSPQSDDVTTQESHNGAAWQNARGAYLPGPPGALPENRTPSFDRQQRAASSTPTLPTNLHQGDITRSEVYHRMLEGVQVYKRYMDSVSESGSAADGGSSDGDRLHDLELRSNAELNNSKTSSGSPSLSELEMSPNKINATLMLTTAYQRMNQYQQLNIVYPPPDLVTPATAQNWPMGGDLLLVSPNPGGLADQQDEPMDLSVRPSRSDRSAQEETEKADDEKSNLSDSASTKEEESATAPKSVPLDLTLSVK